MRIYIYLGIPSLAVSEYARPGSDETPAPALLVDGEGGAGLWTLRRLRHDGRPDRGCIAAASAVGSPWSSHDGRDGGGQGGGEVWIGRDRRSDCLDHRLLLRAERQ